MGRATLGFEPCPNARGPKDSSATRKTRIAHREVQVALRIQNGHGMDLMGNQVAVGTVPIGWDSKQVELRATAAGWQAWQAGELGVLGRVAHVN